jgi:enoyl-[acyl-carrier protein] reductase I
MGLMEGKKGLILGVANDRSIAWGIAQALHREGATIGFTYLGEALERRVRPIAFANKEELSGTILNTTREGFRIALEISAYSLIALVKAAEPMFAPNASVLTLTYHGSRQVIGSYNVMGVAKAALEASVRYLAAGLGPRGIRVNAISAGPIRTLAASGIANFRSLHKQFAEYAPLRRHVTIEDVGNAALYLCSPLAAGVTGEIHYVDAGFNVVVPGSGEE